MNNPLDQMLNVFRLGGNPMAIAQQMALVDPQMNRFVQMISGKTPIQLRQMAENMAKQRGTTVEDIARQIGLSVPGKL